MNTKQATTKQETTKQDETTKQEGKAMNTKQEANNSAKRIDDAITKIQAANATYIRKGVEADALEAITSVLPYLTKFDASMEAAGGASIDACILVRRFHAKHGMQVLASFPLPIHTGKVCPAGDTNPAEDVTWFVEASEADIKAAATNGNRIKSVRTKGGKVVRLKGNSKTGEPVRVKMSLTKYFKDYVGADMQAALFEALPAASVNHETDVRIKSHRWDIQLMCTKSVSTSTAR